MVQHAAGFRSRAMSDKMDRTLGKRRRLCNFGLILIIAFYEVRTNAFRNFVFLNELETRERAQREEFNHQNEVEEHFCDRKIKLGAYDQFPIVFLNSFPGSGNT